MLVNFLTLLEKEALIGLAVCTEAHEAFYYVKKKYPVVMTRRKGQNVPHFLRKNIKCSKVFKLKLFQFQNHH